LSKKVDKIKQSVEEGIQKIEKKIEKVDSKKHEEQTLLISPEPKDDSSCCGCF